MTDDTPRDARYYAKGLLDLLADARRDGVPILATLFDERGETASLTVSSLSAEQQAALHLDLPPLDASSARGQDHVIRALEVAAAGHHHVLLSGPPGAGKLMLAKIFPSLIPRTPVRPVHLLGSAVSRAALPSLMLAAQGGILLLEDLGRFDARVLFDLRQAVEAYEVQVPPAPQEQGESWPLRLQLVAVATSCPCGFYGDPYKECVCSTEAVIDYQKRLAILAGSYDVQVEVTRPSPESMRERRAGEPSASIRGRVETAWTVQATRYRERAYRWNADLQLVDELELFCPLEPAAQALLNAAMRQMVFTPRQYGQALRLARTIADLAGSELIKPVHIAEAIQYRSRFRTS